MEANKLILLNKLVKTIREDRPSEQSVSPEGEKPELPPPYYIGGCI